MKKNGEVVGLVGGPANGTKTKLVRIPIIDFKTGATSGEVNGAVPLVVAGGDVYQWNEETGLFEWTDRRYQPPR